MYRREEDDSVRAFYDLSGEFLDVTPGDVSSFVECLAAKTGLPRHASEYPTDEKVLGNAAVEFVNSARGVFGFRLALEVDDDRQLDRFVEQHLIAPALRRFFEARTSDHLSEAQEEEYWSAAEGNRVPNEPLLFYAMGAYWGEWQVRHRRACWALYPPLEPVQCFPDMIILGATHCSHPFSQVCKKLIDPEGDNLAYKVLVSSTEKRCLPPFLLLASLADAKHAALDLLPEPARRAADAEEAGNDQEAWELFSEAGREKPQPQLLVRMIACAWRLKKYDAVESLSQRLLELEPDHPLTCHNLAVLYSNYPDLMDAAITLLNRALTSDPRYARAHITLASCLAQSNRKEEARRHAEWVRDNNQQLKSEAEQFLAELGPRGFFARWFKK